MHRFRIFIALAGLIALVALPAVAADNGFYLGGSVGQSSVELGEGSGCACNDFSSDDTSYKVFAGYRILTFVAVEGSYVDFGKPNDTLPDQSGTYEAKIKGYDLYAVGMVPLGIADIFVKAGMIQWDSDLTATVGGVSSTVSNSGTDPAYGAGVQFRIRSFAIRGEVEYFDIKDTKNVYMYSVGGSYTF